MNATYLTAIRTAAGSANATRCLSAPGEKHLVIFGAGLQAECHVKTVCCVRDICHISIVNRSEESANALIARLKDDFKEFTRDSQGAKLSSAPYMEFISAHALDQVQASVEQADIICTTTGSSEALFPASWVKAGAHVNAVGSYQKNTTELEPALVGRVNKLCIDTHDAWGSGDLGKPLDKGLVKIEDAFTLGKLLIEPASIVTRDQGDISLFKSVGVAVQDIVTASQVYQECESKDIGTIVDL
jgi:ornithine cyclodeaminase